MRKQAIRVFIADDDNMLIDGLMLFFNEVEEVQYIGRANTPTELLKKGKEFFKSIDIILMDVTFRNHSMDGVELAKKIRKKHPGNQPRIVFMTITNKAIIDPENGFHGIIPKNQGLKELIDNLRDIHYRQAVFLPPSS